jgi:hypothetical protein
LCLTTNACAAEIALLQILLTLPELGAGFELGFDLLRTVPIQESLLAHRFRCDIWE